MEPAVGNFKENLGFREFLTRGLKSVRNEFNLVCTAVNLRKIWIYSIKNKLIGKEIEINGNFHFKKKGIKNRMQFHKAKKFQFNNR